MKNKNNTYLLIAGIILLAVAGYLYYSHDTAMNTKVVTCKVTIENPILQSMSILDEQTVCSVSGPLLSVNSKSLAIFPDSGTLYLNGASLAVSVGEGSQGKFDISSRVGLDEHTANIQLKDGDGNVLDSQVVSI